MVREKKKTEVSEKENTQNVFSKFYNYLEDKYSNFSNWISEKGIPLNDLNNYIEEKGLPAFAIIISSFLLILFIIFFLIFFSFSNQSTLSFNVTDFQGSSLSDVYLTVSSSKGNVFSGLINNNDSKKIKLKIGETYSFNATKENYPNFSRDIKITDKKQNISINFSENIEYGILKIKLRDNENKRTISAGSVKINFTANNRPESVEGIVDIYNNHFISVNVPISKDLELLVKADGYEDYKEVNYRITSKEQEKVIDMVLSNLSFEGKSRVTFIVLDKDQKFISDAEVSVFNLSGEEIATQKTIDGKALAYINTGETISYRIKKEGYKTFVSDTELSLRIRNLEETFTSVLELGGNFLNVKTVSKSSFLSLSDVTITLYDFNNNVLDSMNTDAIGEASFKGLSNKDLIVTACKQDFLCDNKVVDIENQTSVEFLLERIDVSNSAILNIFVVDEKNLPVTKASLKIYELLVEKNNLEVPYNTSLQTDITGSSAVPLRVGKTYRVYAIVGETDVFEDITINALRENKLIFVVDNASKLIKLDLYDENGLKINSGNLLIKTKDGTVLYDENISFGKDIIFNTEGYKDFIAEITDENGHKSYVNFSTDQADSSGYVRVDINKKVNLTDYPVIEFAGVVDARGIKTNYITTDKEYYLVFDVLFPENTFKGEVHIRAGDDSQTDSQEMSYGITGFSAMDITDFRYGTTYNSEPAPGMQGIDLLNQGSAEVVNKWLELKWVSNRPLGNKQIKVKVNAIDLSVTKLKFKYRTLYEENKLYYRDPIDSTLNQTYSNSQKGALYAQTKEVLIDLFDVPLECKGDVCVSYRIFDSRDNSFNIEDFFAIKGEAYSLEASIYSLKNSQLNLLAETSKSFPLISFSFFSDNFSEKINLQTNLDNTQANRDNFIVNQNSLKKVYLSFISKEIGTAYVDLKATDTILGGEVFNNRLSFNVYDKKEMKAVFNPDIYVPYGSKFSIEVIDSVTLKPIENAVVSFYDDRGSFISSIKSTSTNGKNGIYTIENKFNISTVDIVIESYGYSPLKKQIYIVDDSLLLVNPREILINLGLDQITSTFSFSLQNNAEYQVTNIRFGETIWIEGSNEILIDVRGSPLINKNSSQNYQVIVTTPNNFNFTTAYANIVVYASIGPREITKIIPVRINKGLLLSDCLEITPNAVNSFVGLNLKYAAPDLYNTPVRSYDYSSLPQNSNPLLAPSQNYSNYNEYLQQNNYTQNYSSSPNNLTYTDPNYYTYYSSKPDTKQEYTENTTFFIIKNNCSQTITFNPQSVLKSSSQSKEVELSLATVTVLAGEEKVYDVIIKNYSNSKQPKKFTYNILWHNNYYSVSPSTLNVDLLDLSKALWVMPNLINVPISQIHAQRNASNATRFFIKNIGTVPITDIQISQYPKMYSSNIGIKEYPREIPILEPGATVPIDLQFTVNINKSTIDNVYLLVTGKAVGYKNPITATTQLVFSISSPNCLKVSNKNLVYDLKLGEKRARNITLTNYCAEPVSIVAVDKKEQGYFETFGNNAFRIYPTTGNNLIYPNQSVTYGLEVSATSLGGSPKMPMVLIGALLNSGNPVSSEDFTVSINISDLSESQSKDRDVTIFSSMNICSDEKRTDSVSMPLISIGACSEGSGYCDAVTSTEYILKKVNELSSQIKQHSSQAQAKLLNTSCPINDARNGFCKISDLGGNIRPIEFTYYMQNDIITTELVRSTLQKSNYDFRNYFVETNPFNSNIRGSQAVYLGGNKILVSNELVGCGKYTVEIDGFIAASPDFIYPERAYYFINVLKVEDTNNCKKDITNYLNYLPWDLGLDKNNRQGTWLTLFTGDENLSKDLIKGIGKFKSDQTELRYVYNRDVLSTRNSTLNVTRANIVENPNALAKISFNDTKMYDKINPEQINIVLNNLYSSPEGDVPEKVKRDFINLLSSMMTKNDYRANVCISEDKTYMLILDVIKAGDLAFNNKDTSLKLSEKSSCLPLKLKSSMDETLKITSTELSGASVGFRRTSNDGISNELSLSLKQNVDSDFFVCVTPLSPDNISTLVGQKINVTASSIYSADGTIGNRNARAEITLSSCAITPSEYLLKIYDEVLKEANKKDQDKEFPVNITALVDWSKEYNPSDKEKLCDALQKVMDSGKYNGDFFYNYDKLGCELKDPSQKTTSKINKGLTNAGAYFLRCSGSCALCYGVSAIFMPTTIVGAVVDCLGFSCLLPALEIFASTMTDGEGGIGWVLDKFFGFLFANEELSFFRDVSSNIGNWVEGILGVGGSAVGGVLKFEGAAAAAPLTSTTLLLDYSDPTTQSVINAVNTSTGTPPVTPPLNTSTALVGNELTSFKNQAKNFNKYIGGTDPIRFLPDPADNTKFINIVTKMPSAQGAISPIDIDLSKLTSQEIDDFADIIKRGSLTGKNAHAVKKDLFAQRIVSYKANLSLSTPPVTPPVTSNFIEYDPTDFKAYQSSVDDQINAIQKSIDDLTKKKDLIEKNNKRSKINPKKAAVSKANADLSVIDKEIKDLEAFKKSLTDMKTKIGASKMQNGKYQVPVDIADDLEKIANKNVTLKNVSKASRWKSFGKSFGRGLGCGIFGNIMGINGLKDDGKLGLNSAIEITDLTFEKNIYYISELDYLPPGDNEYESRYIVDIKPYLEINSSLITEGSLKRVDSCVVDIKAS